MRSRVPRPPADRANRARRGSGCTSRRPPWRAPHRAPAASAEPHRCRGARAWEPVLRPWSPLRLPSLTTVLYCLAESVTQVLAVGKRGCASVAEPVDAAGQSGRLAARRLKVPAVHADRGRAHELLAFGVVVRRDLAHLHRPRVEA